MPVGGVDYRWRFSPNGPFTSRSTLQKVTAGNTRVSIGIYVSVLQALGLLDGLSTLANIRNDGVAQALAHPDLPARASQAARRIFPLRVLPA